jgi:hypothetical protein
MLAAKQQELPRICIGIGLNDGDFIEHYEYGIGCFRGTRKFSKPRLSPDEIQKRDERRAELLKQQITPEDKEETRSKFGTAQDLDPISNPQKVYLRIAFTDELPLPT